MPFPSGVPCSWQKYLKVPGASNFVLFDSPGWKIAVSNDLSTAVAECGLAPSFFQMIVVPALIVISGGPNSKSLSATATSVGAACAGAACAGVAVGATACAGAAVGAACALPPSPTLITPDMPPPPAP